MKKQLSYAYPNSEFAVRSGYAETGCWLVETVKTDRRAQVSSTHKDRQSAERAWAKIKMPVSDWCISKFS